MFLHVVSIIYNQAILLFLKHTSNDALYRSRTGILFKLKLTDLLLMCLGSVWNNRLPLDLSAAFRASTMLLISRARASANSATLIPLGACEKIEGVDLTDDVNPGMQGLFLFRPALLSATFLEESPDAILQVSETACRSTDGQRVCVDLKRTRL